MSRAAVQVGGAWLRVATDDGFLAAVAVGGADVATVLAGLLDGPVDELVVVHPAAAAPPAPGVPAGVTPLPAARVRTVPAPVAALAGDDRAVVGGPTWPGDPTRVAGAALLCGPVTGGRAHDGLALGRAGGVDPVDEDPVEEDPVAGDAVVVDVGHRGAEVTRIRGGRVVAVRSVEVGGERLDAVTSGLLTAAGAGTRRSARALRETLSLLPEARVGSPPVTVTATALEAALAEPLAALVDAVRTVVGAGPGPPPPVLLVGGVARAPLVAELLDAAGVAGVRVADRPDAAAVTGALRLPPAVVPPVAPPSTEAPDAAVPDAAVPDAAVPDPGRRDGTEAFPSWLPPVAPRRRRGSRTVLGVLTAVAMVAGLLAAGAALPAADPAPAAGVLVQYGYAVDLPAGWAHTGGLPERRRSLLTPAAAPDGSDLVSVERSPLGYDAGAEPERARAELRATFAAAVARGAPLSGFDDDAAYAGRAVVTYRESGDAADVDWFVVLDGDAQLSVGCRHTRAGAAAVRSACATVVRSLRRAH